MSFHQYIQYKALDRMYATDNDSLLDMVIRDPEVDLAKAKLKNVCALISEPLFNDLDEVCSFLEISKRKFIEGALIDAIEKANVIMHELGVNEHFAQLADSARQGVEL